MPQAIPTPSSAKEAAGDRGADQLHPTEPARRDRGDPRAGRSLGTAPATPLLTKIRETAVRLDEAFDVHGNVSPAIPLKRPPKPGSISCRVI